MRLLNDMFSVSQWSDDRIQIKMNAGHPIYQAHFPGNPITPGVCIVKLISELLGQMFNSDVSLTKIVNLKFIAPISPVSYPAIDIVWTAVEKNAKEVKAKGVIMSNDKMLTKFSLIFNEAK
ncbi:MAG: beta-hydroxyacyl-ACP dehydratase [Prevotella sp.]|nr:beta-hydroxyacyl-ACP dehydratase [Prevotella sp.]MBP5508801.1 beta-hydroxyacyl-ACP dehydratase [Prevotella sp.]